MSILYRFYLSITISLIFLTGTILPQDPPPVEWEEIPLADLKMTSFPADSNANALILCDYAESRVNNDLNVEYKRHLRVKILNQNGFDWGKHSIVIYRDEGYESLYDLEGMTYFLDDKGEIESVELDDDDIFEEEIDDKRTKYSFTLPSLKAGCVIEIRYRIVYDGLFHMPGWIFQEEDPVRWSEYRISYPVSIAYAVVYSGYEPWYVNEYKEEVRQYSGTAISYVGDRPPCHNYRYVVKDAPAMRDEPYVTTMDDYKNRIDVQLAGYSFIHTGVKQFLQDWKSLVKDLLDHENFGEEIDVTGDVEETAAAITKSLKTPEEKLEAVYEWVSKSIVWDERHRVFAEKDVDEVLELKKGNSAEITFLLLSLLKSAGIEGHPVILSTRANGKIQEVHPIISQFNYVVAKVTLNNKTWFIDATDPLRPLDLLPVKVLGVRALVIKEPLEWVNLSTEKKNQSKTLIVAKVNENGSLTGQIEFYPSEYRSLTGRKDLTEKKDIDLAKDFFESESRGFSIDSVVISDKDSITKPLKIQSWFSSDSYCQKSGDLIYMNPLMVHRMDENPFKTEKRNYPVDFAYCSGSTIVMNITIPEGYEVKEKFNDRSFYAGKNFVYTRKMSVNDNMVQMICKLDIKESLVKPQDYSKLKNFYSQIVNSQGELLVIGPKETKDTSETLNTKNK